MKRFLFLAAAAMLIGCGAETADKNPIVIIETSKGTIKVELFADKAPITVKNFLSYADDKFYDGTVFHRVIGNFMIQGGGFEPVAKDKGKTDPSEPDLKEKGKTKPPIKNESKNGLSNERGTIAMARLPDPDSATAQFYINVKDNHNLDATRGASGYAVFGKVIEGMDVVDKIKQVQTTTKIGLMPDGKKGPLENAPEEDVVIKSIRRADNVESKK
ncbi:MAG TPA: peptidylprolyl isomerase [Gemmataceae bacterium]|nr:peptidylprolyl isomerase [Gemmataceae bacterium]